ncbi:MAG: beta-N-acetylhexosaminidase [Prevotella sp.]|nr:beta-N-acetylhexosaminidase [Prevotella sp.]
MKKLYSLICLTIGILVASVLTSNAQGTADYQVIPLPDQITMQKGKPFVLDKNTVIVADNEDGMARNAQFLQEYIRANTGIEVQTGSGKVKNAITLKLDKTIAAIEGYRVSVGQKGISIGGSTPAGVFYGIQMLRKALPCDTLCEQVVMPAADISDSPRFGYRGMHLDVARHFFDTDFVKEYIDLLAMHNMNVLHFHLTDDQGWRIEIKRYPKLTEVGAYRSGTVLGRNSNVDDHIRYGGYYTQEQLRDIVKYAQERHITVIPEIEMPGHMLAALASYPELGCTGGPYQVGHYWGVYTDILCAGKEETFTFLKGVLDEVMDIFPSEFIHIGGDEAPKQKWEKCPLCQKRIEEMHIKANGEQSAENLLQGYFTNRINDYLRQHGRRLIGWDEITECGVDKSATVMSWRGSKPGIEAAKLGHDVIMAPSDVAYFDKYQTEDTYFEPKLIGGNISVEKVYNYEPVAEGVAAEDANHILGMQANLWTEYIHVKQLAEYQVLPRMAALAEVQWTAPAKKDYQQFLPRLDKLVRLYRQYGLTYGLHVWPELYKQNREVF